MDFDPWNVHLPWDSFTVRNLRAGDLPALRQIEAGLGPHSREMFAYPWRDPAQLQALYEKAIAAAVARQKLFYLIWEGTCAIGQMFLTELAPGSTGLRVPTLGLAIADAYHGRGLGRRSVQLLLTAARGLEFDAVELTTALTNAAGYQTYCRAGFKEIGTLRLNLGTKFRDERHMVYCLHPGRHAAVLEWLAAKRASARA